MSEVLGFVSLEDSVCPLLAHCLPLPCPSPPRAQALEKHPATHGEKVAVCTPKGTPAVTPAGNSVLDAPESAGEQAAEQ